MVNMLIIAVRKELNGAFLTIPVDIIASTRAAVLPMLKLFVLFTFCHIIDNPLRLFPSYQTEIMFFMQVKCYNIFCKVENTCLSYCVPFPCLLVLREQREEFGMQIYF